MLEDFAFREFVGALRGGKLRLSGMYGPPAEHADFRITL